MRGAIPPLPQYAFMAWCSVQKKAQGQLYLYLYFLNIGSRLRWMYSFTFRPLYPEGREKLSVMYEGVSRSFRTGSLERELQIVQLSATKCSFTLILWVSLVSFASVTLCVASQRLFIVVVHFIIDSVRKLLDTPPYSDKYNTDDTGKSYWKTPILICCTMNLSLRNVIKFNLSFT
jgi:hypothetical protein